MNANFNGNIYLGYRIDRFQLHFEKTPVGIKKSFHHRGITIGGFGGFGATSVNPWTTDYAINDEYDGFVLTRGLCGHDRTQPDGWCWPWLGLSHRS